MTAEFESVEIIMVNCSSIKQRIDKLISELEQPVEAKADDTRTDMKAETLITDAVPSQPVRRASSTVALMVCAAVLIVMFLIAGAYRL